jgi:hypothetical protein
MPKSPYYLAVDQIQKDVQPYLRQEGFKRRGRSFNRTTTDGLVQVIQFVMGPSDPPGTTYVSGLTMNYHGLFWVELGVYIPEVARLHMRCETKSWVTASRCSIRIGLVNVAGYEKVIGWRAEHEDVIVDDVFVCLKDHGLPFMDRFESREKILAELHDKAEHLPEVNSPRIVSAIIHLERRNREAAFELLKAQALDSAISNPHHSTYVLELASRLGFQKLIN